MARSDAKLKTLPEDIQAEMWRMRTTPVDAEGMTCAPGEGSAMSQAEVREWLAATHGVSSSAGAFSGWESWYATQRLVGNTKQQTLDLMEAMATRFPGVSEADLMRQGQVWFSLKSLENGDAKLFEKLFRLHLQVQELEISQRKIALLEEKARFADEVKKAAENREGGLTAEDMAEIERELKLM